MEWGCRVVSLGISINDCHHKATKITIQWDNRRTKVSSFLHVAKQKVVFFALLTAFCQRSKRQSSGAGWKSRLFLWESGGLFKKSRELIRESRELIFSSYHLLRKAIESVLSNGQLLRFLSLNIAFSQGANQKKDLSLEAYTIPLISPFSTLPLDSPNFS